MGNRSVFVKAGRRGREIRKETTTAWEGEEQEGFRTHR